MSATAVPGKSASICVKLRVAIGSSDIVCESITRPSCGPSLWMSDGPTLIVTDFSIAPIVRVDVAGLGDAHCDVIELGFIEAAGRDTYNVHARLQEWYYVISGLISDDLA